jgi:Ca-activated chloride channel family protein
MVFACAIVGCASSDSSSGFGSGPGAGAGPGGGAAGGGGDFGATQGGVQDMTFARDTVGAGRVPPPEAFVVEAMFSEHDLPVEGAPCTTLLCLRAAIGRAPDRTDEPSAWVQVGMSSTIDPESFERPSLSIVAVVDVSGSMGWRYGDSGTPGGLSKKLLTEVAQQLGDSDRFSIVTYGSSSQVHLAPLSALKDEQILGAIESLSENGSTNMEAGLRLAYEVAADEIGRTDRVRLMLFTDVQPNVGLTEATEFEQLAQAGSEDGAELTVFALGLGLNPDVLRGMSQIRGANAFSLTNPEQISVLMEDSWPWMVSPIAYDLVLAASSSEGFVVAEGYGFPESTLGEASLSVSTVFLSRRRGALLLRIAPENGQAFDDLSMELSLTYQTIDGDPVTETFTKDFSALTEEDFEQNGVRKTVVLARLVASMKEAAELYGTDADSAISVLQNAHAQFEESLDAMEDATLEPERTFSAALLQLMREGATQEPFYGGF